MSSNTTRSNARQTNGTITRGQSLEKVHAAVNALSGGVKNASDAKILLQTKGWVIANEAISLDVLARTLFATVIENKLPTPAANAITAVAFLLTEKLEEGVKQEFADSIAKHIKDTISSLTAQEVIKSVTDAIKEPIKAIADDIQERMDCHARTLEGTAQTQSSVTQDLQKTQELLNETAQNAMSQVRTYSQIAATSPQSPPPHIPPALSHSQIQIQNREQIKRRQVLVDFNRTEDLTLDAMDEETLSRKANDSLRMTWAAAQAPKPLSIKLKSVTLLRNGGLLLELDSPEAATWLRSEGITDKFLEGVGSGACLKNRTYQVIVQFVPILFDPLDETQVRAYEEHNNIPQNSVLKAEWIKPIHERKKNQRVATMRMFHRDAESANIILKQGAYVFNKRVEPKRPRKEPIRCLRCQRFGHERRKCTSDNAYCAKCSGTHDTDTCKIPREEYKCVNCFRPHASYDRDCEKFWEKCSQMDKRCPENGLAFYPTEEQWTWVTAEQNLASQPPPPPTIPHPPHAKARHGLRQTLLTGSNNTPLGPNNSQFQQTHNDPSQ